MVQALRPAFVFFLLFTVLTGVLYPLAVLGIGQAVFPAQANGSPLTRDGHIVGSALIGQSFASDGYFWGRPSAAGGGYDAKASSGSNLGPSSQALADRITTEAARYHAPAATIPVDLLTASGSGLDPHISPAAARFQAARVAQARHLPLDQILALIAAHTETTAPSFLGAPRVNVLELNLALDSLAAQRGA